MKNVLKCVPELEALKNAKTSRKRKQLIKAAEDCVINAVSEIAKNCLNDVISLEECEFKSLKRYKNILRLLKKKTRPSTRRKLLIQKGGVLPFLIPPALTFLASVLGSEISKRI